jgi:hypothetical protein
MEEKRIRREKALQEIAEAKRRRLEARAGGESR